MPESNTESLLAGLPEPGEGKMPPVDAQLVTEMIESLFSCAPQSVAELIGLLRETDDGSDWKTRFALHALVIDAGGKDRDPRRKLLIDSFHGTLTKDHPAPVKSFILSELRYIAGPESIPSLLPLLSSNDVTVADAAAAALVSVGPAAKPALNDALATADGRRKELINHALLQLP